MIPAQEAPLLLHASAVLCQEGALVFLGPNGAGKSTIVSLLQSSTLPFADDLVYFSAHSRKGWEVANGDVCNGRGLLPVEEAISLYYTPVRAVFRLNQDSSCDLKPLIQIDGCRCVVSAFFEIPWNRRRPPQYRSRAFSLLAAACRSIPIYRLHFEKIPGVWDVIYAILGSSQVCQV